MILIHCDGRCCFKVLHDQRIWSFLLPTFSSPLPGRTCFCATLTPVFPLLFSIGTLRISMLLGVCSWNSILLFHLSSWFPYHTYTSMINFIFTSFSSTTRDTMPCLPGTTIAYIIDTSYRRLDSCSTIFWFIPKALNTY